MLLLHELSETNIKIKHNILTTCIVKQQIYRHYSPIALATSIGLSDSKIVAPSA